MNRLIAIFVLSILILFFSTIGASLSSPKDGDPELLSIRQKRQYLYNTDVKGTVGGRRTLFEWNNRKLEGYGEMSRTWDLRKPTVFGGGFDGSSSRGTYNLGSGYQRDKGLKLNSNGRYNLYNNDKTTRHRIIVEQRDGNRYPSDSLRLFCSYLFHSI